MGIEQQLIAEFGSEKVEYVKSIVLISDPDFAYTMFEDAGDLDALVIITQLYFKLED